MSAGDNNVLVNRKQGRGWMPGKLQAYHLMPWAWLVAWALTAVGASISAIYSFPYQSIFAYIGFSAVGWAMACFITVRASRSRSGMTVQLVAWAVAYLVAIPLGLVWMLSRDMVPFLLFLPFVLAGTVGGIASSARAGAWRWVSGVLVGMVFLLSSTISFYVGYILLLVYSSLAQRYSLGNLYSQAWILPEAVFGLVVGLTMRRLLGMTSSVLKDS